MKNLTFHCYDAHTCGNPVRVVYKGKPELVGANMNEKRLHFIREFDWIRKGLMFEPRGHDMMSGSMIYPPHHPENDFAILFIETSGCLPMCGHGTIGTITVGIEKGLIKPKKEGKIRMEAPAGLVEIEYLKENKKVVWAKLKNVVSYLAESNLEINSKYLGKLTFDVAYGGNFYAIFDQQTNFTGIQDYSSGELIQFSLEIRKKINQKYPEFFTHPQNETIRDVTHILWSGNTLTEEATARNAVFYGDKAIDRSPCGTGTSARMAQWFAKGKLKVGDEFIHESIIGTKFTGKIEEETTLNGKKAIVPSIKGWAKIYGDNKISIDSKDDPYSFGFQVI